MSDEAFPELGPEQLDGVLHFLPLFESPGYRFGEWHYTPGQWPYYAYAPEVIDFILALSRHDVAIIFNWVAWQDQAWHYLADPAALERADLLALRKLLTTHVRADRFTEGHLAGALESGHIAAILRRMKQIRDQM